MSNDGALVAEEFNPQILLPLPKEIELFAMVNGLWLLRDRRRHFATLPDRFPLLVSCAFVYVVETVPADLITIEYNQNINQ